MMDFLRNMVNLSTNYLHAEDIIDYQITMDQKRKAEILRHTLARWKYKVGEQEKELNALTANWDMRLANSLRTHLESEARCKRETVGAHARILQRMQNEKYSSCKISKEVMKRRLIFEHERKMEKFKKSHMERMKVVNNMLHQKETQVVDQTKKIIDLERRLYALQTLETNMEYCKEEDLKLLRKGQQLLRLKVNKRRSQWKMDARRSNRKLRKVKKNLKLIYLKYQTVLKDLCYYDQLERNLKEQIQQWEGVDDLSDVD